MTFDKNLQYFVGKPVTVATVSINFRYKEDAMMAYFYGYLELINSDGLILVHPDTKCKSYIFLSQVVAIAEEQVLYEDNPEDAKIIQQYRQEKPMTAAKYAIPPKEIDPQALQDILKKAKQN